MSNSLLKLVKKYKRIVDQVKNGNYKVNSDFELPLVEVLVRFGKN